MRLSVILLMIVGIEPRSRTYLFHGEAMKIMVLAINTIMLLGKREGGGGFGMGILRVKAITEALQQFYGSKGNGENIWIPFV